ncbi:SDR family NAD(P)-dependent oxidoreductase [Corticicoccus populi]|uniref:SDR family NAD(P)-dependent oxidoreductase n=1 Tax=Corticicoccus populi TaxID=1812821 RepID=A0ABW5WSY6_9STAP
MRYIFITGASRGLGEACLDVFRDDRIISVSRTSIDKSYNVYKEFNIDFNEESGLEEKLNEVFQSISPSTDDEIYLINSAGTVAPVKQVRELTAEDYLKNYKVNVLAPAMLIKQFINTFENHSGKKRILTVSSGAAINPVEGWGAYCSSKAAVNMLDSVVRLETGRLDYPIQSAVFSPGVMDTDMQAEIRQSDETSFPDVERFKSYKSSGKLNSAFTVAEVVKKIITADDFSEEAVYNVSDYVK